MHAYLLAEWIQSQGKGGSEPSACLSAYTRILPRRGHPRESFSRGAGMKKREKDTHTHTHTHTQNTHTRVPLHCARGHRQSHFLSLPTSLSQMAPVPMLHRCRGETEGSARLQVHSDEPPCSGSQPLAQRLLSIASEGERDSVGDGGDGHGSDCCEGGRGGSV